MVVFRLSRMHTFTAASLDCQSSLLRRKPFCSSIHPKLQKLILSLAHFREQFEPVKMTGHTAVFKNGGLNQRVTEVSIPFSDDKLLRSSLL